MCRCMMEEIIMVNIYMLANAKYRNEPCDLLLLAFIMFSLTVRSICVSTHPCVNVCRWGWDWEWREWIDYTPFFSEAVSALWTLRTQVIPLSPQSDIALNHPRLLWLAESSSRILLGHASISMASASRWDVGRNIPITEEDEPTQLCALFQECF